MHLFLIGYPGDVGGANTECWHTIRLWRHFGVDVTLIPTWSADPVWRRRLEAIGCRTVIASPERLGRVVGLGGSVVVSFCNAQFLQHADRFRRLGCRIVWLGCMNWLFTRERRHYQRFGPFDRYVFQSRYQQETLLGRLSRHGVTEQACRVIHGAFFADEFPLRRRNRIAGQTLVVGRLSRSAGDKFAAGSWSVYERIGSPRRVRVMGFSDTIRRKLGPPPSWAECLPAGAESPGDFLGSLDVLMALSDTAIENWPRVGLEAMATGTPVVAENRGGWPEMIRHGRTGLLFDSDDEAVAAVDRLASDEPFRLELIRQARGDLQTRLADPETLFGLWQELLEGLE